METIKEESIGDCDVILLKLEPLTLKESYTVVITFNRYEEILNEYSELAEAEEKYNEFLDIAKSRLGVEGTHLKIDWKNINNLKGCQSIANREEEQKERERMYLNLLSGDERVKYEFLKVSDDYISELTDEDAEDYFNIKIDEYERDEKQRVGVQTLLTRAERLLLKVMKERKEKSIFKFPKLPLSEQTYKELENAIRGGIVKWEQLPIELNHAYQMFEAEKRSQDWAKAVSECRVGYYE